MRKHAVLAAIMILTIGGRLAAHAEDANPSEQLAKNIQEYFNTCFEDLKSVADQYPTVETFREAMEPIVNKTDGFFGGTLIDANFVISEVYYKRDFLARGFDLKKVRQLDRFWAKMRESPAPQLSEPARGNIMQPRLVAMRYPVLRDGKLVNIVSMMVRTESFLAKTGLDKRPAYSIVCDGIQSEKEGVLSENPHEIKLALPSTEWIVQFE